MQYREKEWHVLPPAPDEYLPSAVSDPIYRSMLWHRGLTSNEQVKRFFNVSVDKLSDPYLMKGVDLAVKRISKALKSGEKVRVFGDYDADGIMSTAILWEALYGMGVDVLPYIPDRKTEGYGLNREAIDKFLQDKVSLLITVDCGISNSSEVDYAKTKGMDVIVTDHHDLPQKLPKAVSVINPKQKGDRYPFKDLAGSGVVFTLCRALVPKDSSRWLELAGFSTITDLVPLLEDNRVFVKIGLADLQKTSRVGLKRLMAAAGVDTSESLLPYHVGFILGPRLNAMGRIDHAMDALRLVCTKDFGQAEALTQKLQTVNAARQDITNDVFEQAKLQLEGQEKESLIVLEEASWEEGILGLVAGKIMEMMYRPVIVIGGGNKYRKASARSIRDFNIIEAVSVHSEMLAEFGGHPMAAGFSISADSVDKFRKNIQSYAASRISVSQLEVIPIEGILKFSQIDWPMVQTIEQFTPFGFGNEEPIFVTYGAEASELQTIGKDHKHLKMTLIQDGIALSAIAFGRGWMIEGFRQNPQVDVAYTVNRNVWNGRQSIQLKIVDFKNQESWA